MRRIVRGLLLVCLAMVGSCKAEVSCGKKRASAQAMVHTKMSELLGTKVDAVVCPKSDGKKGDTMVCTSAVDGIPFGIDVSYETNDDLHMATRGIVLGGAAEKYVARRIEEDQHVVAKVDCGPRIRPIVVGESFTCSATVGSETKTARLTMNDDSGSVSMTLE